jgi:hypothetical protein
MMAPVFNFIIFEAFMATKCNEVFSEDQSYVKLVSIQCFCIACAFIIWVDMLSDMKTCCIYSDSVQNLVYLSLSQSTPLEI